jgi:hypothetical protein
MEWTNGLAAGGYWSIRLGHPPLLAIQQQQLFQQLGQNLPQQQRLQQIISVNLLLLFFLMVNLQKRCNS